MTTARGTVERVSTAAQAAGLPKVWADELARSMGMWDACDVTPEEVAAALVHRVRNPGAACPKPDLAALIAAVREPGATARIVRAVVTAWHVAATFSTLDAIAAGRAA